MVQYADVFNCGYMSESFRFSDFNYEPHLSGQTEFGREI